MKFLSPIAFILAVFLMACGGTQPPVSTEGITTGDSAKLPASFNKVYVGILNTDSVLMQLEAKDRILSGAYFYKGKADRVFLSGSLSGADSVRLEGIDAANKQMMVFIGTIKGAVFSGEWSIDKPIGKFSFTESTLEFAPEKYVVIDTLEYKMVKAEKKDKAIKCSCKTQYPVLDNPDNKAAITKINTDIKKNFTDVMDDCKDYEPYDEQTSDYENEAIGDVIFNNGEIVGVQLEGYVTGGAHPSHWNITYYYDVATGSKISLIDLFQGENLKKLSALATQKLHKEHKVKKLTTAGFNENNIILKGSECFFVSPKDSTFSLMFNADEISPYFMGAQFAEFSYKEVRPLLSNRTAFSKIIK